MINTQKTVITYGTFDMFHKGHLHLLERAKALGDYLIVGVTDENYDRSRGKLNVIESTQQRMQAIEALGAKITMVNPGGSAKPLCELAITTSI